MQVHAWYRKCAHGCAVHGRKSHLCFEKSQVLVQIIVERREGHLFDAGDEHC